MPKGFSDGFSHYLALSDGEMKRALTSGIVVPDTNVLLSAYRFASTARNELISALERLADRILIPHQVALEFHRNRLEVISDQVASYGQVLAELRSSQERLNGQFDEKFRWLANRTALSDAERDHLVDLARQALQPAIAAIEELQSGHGTVDIFGKDNVLGRLQQILDGKVDRPFSDEEEQQARAEATRRIKEEIPPGYKDSDKKYPYGDYFVWKQALTATAERKAKYLVFVTSDSKEDWYHILKGRVIGARPELAAEAWTQAGAKLVMLSITQFLDRAKRYLGASVSPETIQRSRTLPSPDDKAIERAREAIDMLQLTRDNLRVELADADAQSVMVRHDMAELEQLLKSGTHMPNREVLRDRLAQRMAILHNYEMRRAEISQRLMAVDQDLQRATFHYGAAVESSRRIGDQEHHDA